MDTLVQEADSMKGRVVVAAVFAVGAARSSRCQSAPKPSRPAVLSAPPAAGASELRTTAPDSITLHIVDTDLRSAVQILQQYLDKPVIYTGQGPGPAVSLESPHLVARVDIPRLLRGLLDAQGYEFVDDTASGTYRARPREVVRSSPSASPFALQLAAARQSTTAPELFVIELKHARAVDVAGTINALFGRMSGAQLSGMVNSRAPTLSDELRTLQTPPIEPPLPQAIPGTAGRAATLSGDLTIVPDAHANSLLIRATRADFQLIQAAVQQLDVRPAQVLIEVLIVEARRDRSFSLGIEASMKNHRFGNSNTTGTGTFTPQGAGLGDFTLDVMGGGTSELEATIAAAAARGDVKIVSRPVVLAANDEEAEVVVGSQRPFVQVSRALPTDDAVRDQVVQYKDVGTKLTVRPTISVDGTVQLNVTQEVSNATTETAFNAPVISTRSIRTDLLARDSQTIVLGGLTDREHDVQTSGIPILSSIPYLGGFFGNHSRTTAETELFIFLTPRVIRNDDDAARLTEPLRTHAKTIEP
jgi:type II secretory pathway component GspD/PulD (secretin)